MDANSSERVHDSTNICDLIALQTVIWTSFMCQNDVGMAQYKQITRVRLHTNTSYLFWNLRFDGSVVLGIRKNAIFIDFVA